MKTWTTAERYRRLDAHSTAEYATLQAQAAACRWRQHYHIQPPAGLLNDPNGFCYDGENYHLFYQWFPLGAVHGLKYWRALESRNLVQFQDRGIAISPDSEYDSHGAYSGSAIAQEDGSLLIAYTGNHRTENWQRIPYQLTGRYDPKTGNFSRHLPPFMAGPPVGYTEHVRDPKIWQENGKLYTVLGAQRENRSGCALITENGGLLGELNTALTDFGYMWECPDFFTLNSKKVLIFSPQGLPALPDGRQANLYQSGYLIGDYDRKTRTLTHQNFAELDAGFDFYAPQTCAGKDGQRLLIAWLGMPDTAYPTDDNGWQGCLSLPRVLSIENGTLRQRPLPALEKLRSEKIENPTNLAAGELLLENPTAAPFSLALFAGSDCQTLLTFDGAALTLDRSKSGRLPEILLKKIPTGKNSHIRRLSARITQLQIYLDSSSLEIFINNGEAVMSARIFPPKNAYGILHSGAGQLDCWQYY
ncbi:sucrose-6-phosphate hydrolase [Suttonella ornithocola]|uniref:Sucrose-6-phosphate hydrolase n=1 Tax=Suttonella ornithocola TaxID=279832 RepID=A0A380MMI4_9GAMM|nr:sucrose-6-phosphate hydrolase [Suttonella ornithocola]SUO93276.1 Sucrose-6-phosphate hydrolase [Suttonella ornithocola]